MSYRELRSFVETMRSLGYTRVISMESFRTPNFELVADILYWLVQRHDPSAEINVDIKTEGARINFLKSIAELLQVKVHIKLNCKRLYQADGHAAQELLKLATVLQQAMTMRKEVEDDRDIHTEEVQAFDSKVARNTATELSADGAKLYDLLQVEIKQGEERYRLVAQPQEHSRVEKAVNKLLQEILKETEQMQEAVNACAADAQSLQSKIEHKRTQLERTAKRLRSLESTRPAHQEEYEHMETEMAQQYAVYLENFRNLEFLESEMTKYNELEERLIAEQENKLRVLREKLRREELNQLREADKMEEEAAARASAERAAEAVHAMTAQRQSQQPNYASYMNAHQQHLQQQAAQQEANRQAQMMQQQAMQQQQFSETMQHGTTNRPARPTSVRRQRQPSASQGRSSDNEQTSPTSFDERRAPQRGVAEEEDDEDDDDDDDDEDDDDDDDDDEEDEEGQEDDDDDDDDDEDEDD